MSKILCTLAFYHDGGTLKPQLVLSSNPTTNIVMKGSDWKGVKFGNMNAADGSRDRFEYSFTGGKSVTRCSLVMNTSAILPPMIWLSKHPSGHPTKKGLRAKPGTKAHEDAHREEARKNRRLAAKEDLKRLEGRKPKTEREQMLAEHGMLEGETPEERNERLRNASRSSSSNSGSRRRESRPQPKVEERFDLPPPPYADQYIPDRETRREERMKRLRGNSVAGSPPPVVRNEREKEREEEKEREREREREKQKYGILPETYASAGIPDREARRQERLKRLRSESSASEGSGGESARYRRSTRGEREKDAHRHRQRRERYGGTYATGREDMTDGDGDGDGGGDGGGG